MTNPWNKAEGPMTKLLANQLTLINNFVQIVSAGSFSRAAQQLNTSQPTVSRQLRMLEAHLNIKLLNRNTRGISLSEAGRRYYEYSRSMWENLDRFEGELRDETNYSGGLLRVVVPSGFGQSRLIEVAAQYLKANPAIRLEWKISDSPARFVDDAIDCSIQVDAIKDELVVARKLGEVNKIIVASPALLSRYGNICKPEDASILPWVTMPSHHCGSIQLQNQWNDIRKLDISPSFMADSVPVARQATLQRIGATLISNCAVSGDIAAGTLARVLPDWSGLPVSIYLTYPKSPHYSLKFRKFIDLITSLPPQFFTAPDAIPLTPAMLGA
jgi:DNA-binding transcriptional LysR family regulator